MKLGDLCDILPKNSFQRSLSPVKIGNPCIAYKIAIKASL